MDELASKRNENGRSVSATASAERRMSVRVKDCKGCRYCERKVWSSSYKPANYHAVGVSHAYHYCAYHKKRCLKVKWCNDYEEEEIDGGAYAAHMDIGG